MTWIYTVPFDEADKNLRGLYQRIKGPNNNVDNIMMAHSLRIHSMEGHLSLYKAVLHHRSNVLPRWFLECIGLYVSLINNCDYCAQHHYEGMSRLIEKEDLAVLIWESFLEDNPSKALKGKELAAVNYAKLLTCTPSKITEDNIKNLRSFGFDDGEILEINQVVSYFNYANRVVLGLGVTTDGDILGLSPSAEDPDDLSHM